jgi:sulfite reductase alpha subunit-like flavoprotein
MTIIAEQAGVSSERAHEYLRTLTERGRYQRDVY